MGEIFLASFVIVVLDRLISDEMLNVASQLGIHSQLKQWTKILKKIRIVLADAELKQYVDRDVKNWLNNLEDLAYDMDDTIDGFATQVGQRAHSQASSSTGQVSTDSFSTFKPNYDMVAQIDEITLRLQEIFQDKDDLSLKENNNIVRGIQFQSSTAWKRLPSSSLVESHVYGREEEKKAILEILFNDEAVFADECVVTIVGMGGVGKTTLAQLLYNDEKVKCFFSLKAWAFVSDNFDVLEVTKKIFESLSRQPCDLKNLDAVQVKLQEELSGKKFLVVLDDIWEIEKKEWNLLSRPFLAGARGSKIIVTTRSVNVAKQMSLLKINELKQLGDHHSLSLLAHHALGRDNFEEYPDLKEIGEKILKKCQGLPLAVTTLGGLLRTKEHQSQWEDILYSEVWDLSGDILPALLLSYHYLPSHLKRCFAYCAIIPKECEFTQKDLILLWMAVGLLPQSNGRNRTEDFGGKYFDDLLSRSFFQTSTRDESKFVMHDLINDVAESVAGELCFRWEDTKISSRARHSSYTAETSHIFENFDFNRVQRLRTFASLQVCTISYCVAYVDSLLQFKFLRVLHVNEKFIIELPDSIGMLKHLRYLDLSYTNIEVLPASICTLYNLQTLLINYCLRLKNLPADIGNLINLRHLDNTACNLKEMPCGISKLTSLQTMPKFFVGKGSGSKLGELQDLMLRGSFSISGLENVMDSQDAEESLKLKHELDELELVWKSSPCEEDNHDEKLESDVLDMLQPHRNLKKLKINGYRCSKISSWVGDPSFCELFMISITNCRNCTSLPPLWGLPKLKHLDIQYMFELRSISDQFYDNGFCGALEYLYIGSCEKLVSLWPNGFSPQSLVCLKELKVVSCPQLLSLGEEERGLPRNLEILALEDCDNLEKMPHGLSSLMSLKSLEISRCPKVESFPRSAVSHMLNTQDIECCGALETQLPNYSAEISHLYVCISSMSLLRIESLQNFANLYSLNIYRCDGLQSFPETGWAGTFNLRFLNILSCDNFKSLRFNQNQRNHLVSLEKLEIWECPKLESFPDRDLPTNLTSLHICYCGELMKPLSEWGLHGLASLDKLSIIGGFPEMVSLSNYGDDDTDRQFLLPPSLTRLAIGRLPNLESLSIALQNLSSLRVLSISNCPKLRSLPKGELLSNLSDLTIVSCPILKQRIKDEGYYQSILALIRKVRLWD